MENNLKKWSNEEKGINEKIKSLVDFLRIVSLDKEISKEILLIPTDCEQIGFVEGKHNLGQLLHFLADMLED